MNDQTHVVESEISLAEIAEQSLEGGEPEGNVSDIKEDKQKGKLLIIFFYNNADGSLFF